MSSFIIVSLYLWSCVKEWIEETLGSIIKSGHDFRDFRPGSLPKPHPKESVLKGDLPVNTVGRNNSWLLVADNDFSWWFIFFNVLQLQLMVCTY